MHQSQILFLKALKCALNQEKFVAEASSEVWMEVFYLAEQHNILPLIFDAVYDSVQMDHDQLHKFRRKVYQLVMLQACKTQEFLEVYQKIREEGLNALVLKGIILRNCYPQPDLRLSSDEDLLIPVSEFDACHQLLTSLNLKTDCLDLQKAYEVPYRSSHVLYIELHKQLFASSDAYGWMNDLFADVFERRIEVDHLLTMSFTDHLFYLAVHALKHFMHSGFGIRQVCDIVMFINRYAKEIDWQDLESRLDKVHAKVFMASMIKIGIKYLNLQEAVLPQWLHELKVDELPMLEDLLESGVYGGSTQSRKHSSNMTLSAVANSLQGKRQTMSLASSLFPSYAVMASRYRYVKNMPFLLPFSWIHRFIGYGLETLTGKSEGALQTIEIGKRRIELLKKYDIVK